jgi:type IX secretion system PorP/SprF family membrane protein
MKKLYSILSVAILLFALNNIYAQDPQFTQFYANPLYLNPALAGSNICPRVSLNFRDQWPALSGNYVTTSASIDKYAYKLHGGIGLIATNDRAGQGTLNTNTFSAIYAYQLKIKRNLTMNFGVQATYEQKYLDWSKLTFGDMIDDQKGFVYNTKEVPQTTKKEFADFDAGVVLFTKRFYAGIAADHLTQPDEGFITTSRLPVKLTANVGMVIPLKGDKGNVSISPNILYQQQGNFNQLDAGMYVNYGPVIGGLWYRSNDSFIALVGLHYGMFKFGYSYDITVSKLTNATAGSHELSITLMFKCKKPHTIHKPVSCPNFQF